MWEDAQNKNGGRWLVNLNKNQRMTELDNFWLETVSMVNIRICPVQSGLTLYLEVSFCLLAHLSRRLTGELIGYPWIRRPSVRRRPFTFSNIFSSETAWPIKAKFYVEPPWGGGTKVYINGPGHMTKMAATPIYCKNLKKSSSPEPAGRFSRNLVCSIEDSCPS